MGRLRSDAGAAVREMRAMGATPLEPFPGTNHPWRARHDRCGREISPSLGNARRRGGVCRFCAAEDRGLQKRLRYAAAAEAGLRAAGWEPLEAYPGADVPWRVVHLACQSELHRSYNTIRSKRQSCNTCYRTAHGHHIWTVESATEVFREIGLTPLEPYPGSSTRPWRARHDLCGRTVSPRLGNVAAGQGPCNLCGLDRVADAHRSDPKVVTAEMRAAGFEPAAPFVSVDAPWRSIHTVCGGEAAPTLSNLRRGQGGCVRCGLDALSRHFTLPEDQARAAMVEKGLTPLEAYPGNARPWKARHTCGRVVSPTLGNVRQGRGICRYCNSAFPYDGPAVVYLVADRNAVKVGCAARDGQRIAEHTRRGWTEAWQIATSTGDDAYALEQSIITWWRNELNAPAHYTAERMPQSGATETVAWSIATPSEVLEMALALAAAADLSVRVISQTATARDERPTSEATGDGRRVRRAGQQQLEIFDLR